MRINFARAQQTMLRINAVEIMNKINAKANEY